MVRVISSDISPCRSCVCSWCCSPCCSCWEFLKIIRVLAKSIASLGHKSLTGANGCVIILDFTKTTRLWGSPTANMTNVTRCFTVSVLRYITFRKTKEQLIRFGSPCFGVFSYSWKLFSAKLKFSSMPSLLPFVIFLIWSKDRERGQRASPDHRAHVITCAHSEKSTKWFEATLNYEAVVIDGQKVFRWCRVVNYLIVSVSFFKPF